MYQEASAFIDTHDYLNAHVQDVQSILLPSTQWGHFGPLEQPQEVASAIVDRLLGEIDADAGDGAQADLLNEVAD